MKEPIIHRLMRELEDGSFEVAGYQVFDNGHILHGHDCRVYNDIFDRVEAKISNISINAIYAPMCVKEGERFICNVESEKPSLSFKHPNYIPHTRIDRWTGVTLNDEAKTKVFERDYLEEVKPKPYYCIAGYVQWNPKTLAWSVVKEGVGQCSLHDMLKGLEYFKESKIKIVGIEGVHKTEEE